MQKNNKNEKGITLIALVITIIVLLILAGISVTMLTGENSILNQAGKAKEQTEEKGIIENISLAYNSGKIEKYAGNKSLSETMEEELAKIYGENNVEVDDNGDSTYTVIINNAEYNIEDGKVEKAGGPIVNPYNPDGWTKAWVYPTAQGKWSDEITDINSLPQNYDIIAKLYEINENDIKYSLVIEGQGELKDIVDNSDPDNPESFAWQTVDSSFNAIFMNQENTVKVIICNGITSIGDSSFLNCVGLRNVKIADSVTCIGVGAFDYCVGLSSVRIPDTVTKIEDFAFDNCWSLTNVKMSSSITSIGNGAFGGCENLTSIEIPNSVTNIGDNAFDGCDALTKVKGGSVAIDYIKSGYFDHNIRKKITEFTVSNGVTEIEDDAFAEFFGLKTINIPDSVEDISKAPWINRETITANENNYSVKIKWKNNNYYYRIVTSSASM